MLPVNAHELCSERLFISLTRYRDFKNVVVSQFDTRDELIQVCSKNFQVFSILFRQSCVLPSFRSTVDGSLPFTEEKLIVTEDSVTISPSMIRTQSPFRPFAVNLIYVREILTVRGE